MDADLVDSNAPNAATEGGEIDSVEGRSGRRNEKKFEADQKRFSWRCGDHPMLQRARERCRRMPGMEEVLLDLVRFDWQRQMSYEVGG